MSEQAMRSKLVRALRPLDAVPVENRIGVGTPDINYAEGWIECKWLRRWPKEKKTPVRLDHPLLPEQRVWLKRRQYRGGKTWVILQCRREWFLFTGYVAAERLGEATQLELLELATVYMPNGLNVPQLIEILRGT